jgi:hypothetical protein
MFTTSAPLLLLLLGASSLASAQTKAHYAPPHDTVKGFWLAHTNPTLRSTTVRFFDGKRQVLYEETLNGQYFELNRSNVSALDDLLAKLTTRELVSASVKAKPLTDEAAYYRSKPVKIPAAEQRSALNRPEGLTIQTKALPDRHQLLVEVDNPPGHRLHFYLENSSGQSLYYNSVVKHTHVQSFGLGQLTEGIYTVRVTNYNQKFQHKQKIQYRNGTITLLN